MNERLIIPIEYNTYCIEYYSTKSSFINFFVKKKTTVLRQQVGFEPF